MSELTEEERATKAAKFATDLAALLNQARRDGLLVSLDTNEYDSHSVGYPTAGGKMSTWITVERVYSDDERNGTYEVRR